MQPIKVETFSGAASGTTRVSSPSKPKTTDTGVNRGVPDRHHLASSYASSLLTSIKDSQQVFTKVNKDTAEL